MTTTRWRTSIKGAAVRWKERAPELTGALLRRLGRGIPGVAGALLVAVGFGLAWLPLGLVVAGGFLLLLDWRIPPERARQPAAAYEDGRPRPYLRAVS